MIARLGELERRQANLIKPGTIAAADYANARVKVTVGGNTTGWLPWVAGRAGGNRSWNPPEIGEQVLVLSPCGELAQGFVLPGIYQNAFAANGTSADTAREDFKDGASIQYDQARHALTADLTDAGTATVKTGAASVVQTKDSIKGTIGGNSAEIKTDSVTLTAGGTTLAVKDGSITMTIGGCTITFDGSGATVAGGDVKADAISLKTHTHSGVEGGDGTTGAPVG